MLCLLALTMFDQVGLDNMWSQAARLWPGEQPPFAGWNKIDVKRQQADHPHSRLMRRQWLQSIAKELKEEDIIYKKRKGDGKGKDADKEGAGELNYDGAGSFVQFMADHNLTSSFVNGKGTVRYGSSR